MNRWSYRPDFVENVGMAGGWLGALIVAVASYHGVLA